MSIFKGSKAFIMSSKNILQCIFIAVTVMCFSCKKSVDNPTQNQPSKDSVANILSFSFKSAHPQINLSTYAVNIRFPDTVSDANNLVANFTLTPGSKATVNHVEQVSGVTKNNFESPLIYVVTNADGVSKSWAVTASNNNYTMKWGMGSFLQQSFSNDRSYSWYYNQTNTGPYSNINCEPSCATMAAKWYDSTFSRTVQQARDYYPINTGVWSLATIFTYLGDFNIPSKGLHLGNSELATRDSIKKQLDLHNIVILELQIGAIRTYYGTSKDPRCDRYYPTSGAYHAILAYGYKEVDGVFYFQVMDPWGSNYFNDDGTSKGMNRYYRSEDIYNGCREEDNVGLIIPKK